MRTRDNLRRYEIKAKYFQMEVGSSRINHYLFIYLFHIAILKTAQTARARSPLATRDCGLCQCRYLSIDLLLCIAYSYLQEHFESKSALYWPV